MPPPGPQKFNRRPGRLLDHLQYRSRGKFNYFTVLYAVINDLELSFDKIFFYIIYFDLFSSYV